MCSTSIFTCIMAMICNFSIFFIKQTFLTFFFHKYNTFLHLDVHVILFFANDNIFSFQNWLYLLRDLLKKYKTFSYNLFHNIKYACFLCDEIPKIVDFEYLQGICSRNKFCCWTIFWIICTSIYFLIKDSMSA